MKMNDGLGVTSVALVTPTIQSALLTSSAAVAAAAAAVVTTPTTMTSLANSATSLILNNTNSHSNSISTSSASGALGNCISIPTTVNNYLNQQQVQQQHQQQHQHQHQHQQQQNNPSANNHANSTQNMADYLAQLIKDKKQLAIFPNLFIHVERILDEEISRVRGSLFHLSGVKSEPLELPEACGPVVTLSEKVYVPVKEHPDFNFVGRILGPRGMTAKQLEQETGCKIMVRGKGSMRDKKKEEQNRGKPNWEHLNDELHVLITAEDTENRGKVKLQRAVEEVKKLLIPAEGEDELKKRQLMELAIINGTYRDSKESRTNAAAAVNAAAAQLVSPQVPLTALRAATPLGFYGFLKHKQMHKHFLTMTETPVQSSSSSSTSSASYGHYAGQQPAGPELSAYALDFGGFSGAPLIISPHRLSNGLSSAAAAAAAAAGAPQLLAPNGTDSLLYAASPYATTDYATYLSLAEYPPEHVNKMSGLRRLTAMRDHPYLSKSDPSASLLH